MKQTAVEWLAEQFDNIVQLYPSEWELIDNATEQAKAMEKEQIFDAWENGFREFYDGSSTPEQYYKKTYEKD